MARSSSLTVHVDTRALVQWGLLVLGVSVLVGGVLFHVFFDIEQLAERWDLFLTFVYRSLIYTTTMFASMRGTARWLLARMPLRSRRTVALHVGILSVVAAAAYAGATGLCWVLPPSGFRMDGNTLVVTVTITLVVTLVWSAFAYMNRFYRQMQEAEAARYEARLEALRAQINPHFLFNAFNSIAALIRTRPDEAETIVEDLADLFRYTLQASQNDVSPLREELEAVRQYLAVERARFRDRLQVEIDVPDALRPVSLPAMTLQPLVENAIKHGVAQTQDDCTVRIAARRQDAHLVLSVTDTGPGFDTTTLEDVLDEGAGLANVRERLRLFFDDEAQMRLRPQGVELWVPMDVEMTAPPTAAPAATDAR